ncbi:MAG: TonB-dependent receptor plug domain-containing protein [Opitutales bacterium]|jgi:outer membrane receptor protein involved in Fe transport|nr:TonB-dependent receptor plug domain-containing protein [Opitutales bacterium]
MENLPSGFIRNNRVVATLAVVASIVVTTSSFGQNDDLKDKVYELSPFSVEAKEDSGYRATTTLAGSRIRSKISDLGSSIAVVTKEFMEDTGATDGESLLSYVGSAEVGGTQGNFSSSSFAGERANTNDQRVNPQGGQRIRGLDAAVVTRDYFRSLLPFDGYNTSRVTINRGPNSVLFGLGSPGGVIDNTLNTAAIGSDFSEVSFRFDHRGGLRGTFDFNRTLVEDRLAVRVSAMHEDIKFKQEPAFEEDTRFFATIDWKAFKNENSSWLDPTTVRLNFENGEIKRNPPDVIPPHDGISGWYTGYEDPLNLLSVPGVNVEDLDVEQSIGLTPGDIRDAVGAGLATVPEGMTLDEYATAAGRFVPKVAFNRFLGARGPDWLSTPWLKAWFIYPAVTYGSGDPGTQAGFNDPALAGISGMFARWRPNGFATLDQMWSNNAILRLPNFSALSIQNRDIFDYHNNLLQGTSNFVNTDFDTYQATVQQTFWGGKAGFDISVDQQNRDQVSRLPFSQGVYKTIHVDITTHQPNGDTDLDGFGDSFVNENFGRPVIIAHDQGRNNGEGISTNYQTDKQQTYRATLFGTLDFEDILPSDNLGKIFGSHTFTGLFEERTNDFSNEKHRPIWNAREGPDPAARAISNGTNDNFRRYLRVATYLGPSAANATDFNDVRVTDTVQIKWPELGDVHRVIYFNNDNAVDGPGVADWVLVDHLDWAGLSQNVLKSDALSIQSRWLSEHIVSQFAWRTDSEDAYQHLQPVRDRFDPGNPDALTLWTPEGEFNTEQLRLESSPASSAEDSTFTWSLVGYFPEEMLFELPFGMDLSAHYYEAESFQPSGISNNILNQPLASPFGSTKEHGFTVSLLDQKLSARFNWYKTVNANGRSDSIRSSVGGIAGRVGGWLTSVFEAEDNNMPFEDTDGPLGGFTTYDEWYAGIINLLPSELKSVYNYEVVENVNPADNSIFHTFEDTRPVGVDDTFDVVAKGFEMDLVGQVTQNWTVSLNLAKQETVVSNTGPVAFPFAFVMEQNLANSGMANMATQPFRGSPSTYAQQDRNVMAGVRGVLAKDGTVSQELRKWRANFITRYGFSEGLLKGASIGGALRYQDQLAAGYPLLLDDVGNQIPDLANAFLGPDEINGDLFFRYGRPIANGKMDWSIQLNARNLYRSNGNDDIPVTINPDGAIATIRIPNERQFFVTNTFRF